MERQIANYLTGEFWVETERMKLGREEVVVTMGFMVAQRFPEATMSDVSTGFSLAVEMIRERRTKH